MRCGGISGIQENLNSIGREARDRMDETGVNAGDVGRYISGCKTRLADSSIDLFDWDATDGDQGRS